MSIATDIYTQQTEMTAVDAPVLRSILERHRNKPKSLNTLDDIVGDVNSMPKVDGPQRHYPYLRTANEIASEGIYRNVSDHDSALVLVGILRELGFSASYGFYFKETEGQPPSPKSVAIVYLPERGRWVVFDAKSKNYVQFAEKIGDYIFRGEGPDPKSMGISDLNTLLRWQEQKRIEALQIKGLSVYTGVYGRRRELIVEGYTLSLPPEILAPFAVRNPDGKKLYLDIGRVSYSKGIIKYLRALDDKAASRRNLGLMPRDTTESNVVEVIDGRITIPQTFHGILAETERTKGGPLKLEAVVIEAERDGEFFKIWGLKQFFEYFQSTNQARELRKRYTFERLTLPAEKVSIDAKTNIHWGAKVTGLLLARHGVITENERLRGFLADNEGKYKDVPEIEMHYRYDGFDKGGNIILTFLDSEPFDGEVGFTDTFLEHDGRTRIGTGVFDNLRPEESVLFRGKNLSVVFQGVDDRQFKVLIKRPR